MQARLKLFRQRFILLALLVSPTIAGLYAQDSGGEQIKIAREYLDRSKYAEAEGVLKSLYRRFPKDHQVVSLYGEALYHNYPDKSKALQVLLSISDSIVNGNNNGRKFLLAQTYQVNYLFDEAIKLYEDLDTIVTLETIQNDYKVYINQCNVAKKLILETRPVQLKKIGQVKVPNLGSRYNKLFGRQFLSQRKFLNKDKTLAVSAAEKNSKEKLILLQVQNGKSRFYSEYVRNQHGESNKDLVFEIKDKKTSWYDRIYLGGLLNTEWDEDYPFLTVDSNTLYFCSNGAESMGGYDIFKSTRDPETGYWGKPVNLGFPVNSPEDEFLYVEDSVNNRAFFSTARFNPYGDATLFELPLEEKENVNVTVFVKKKVKGTKSKKVKQVWIQKANSQGYNYTGIFLPTSNRFMYSVDELEELKINVIFNDSTASSYTFFSHVGSKPTSIELRFAQVAGEVRLIKELKVDPSSRSELVKLMEEKSRDEKKFPKHLEIRAGKNISDLPLDSINFLCEQIGLEWKQKEHVVYTEVAQLNATINALGQWLYPKKYGNNKKVRASSQEQQKLAEQSLNRLVLSQEYIKTELAILRNLRDEYGLVKQLKQVIDTVNAVEDEDDRLRMKQKVVGRFDGLIAGYEIKRRALEQSQRVILGSIDSLKKDILLAEEGNVQQKQVIESKTALLTEERDEGVRRRDNSWFKSRKKKIQTRIDELNTEIAVNDGEVAKLDQERASRKELKQLIEDVYLLRDWKHTNPSGEMLADSLVVASNDSIEQWSKRLFATMNSNNRLAAQRLRISSNSELEGSSHANAIKVTKRDLAGFDLEKLRVEERKGKAGNDTIIDVSLGISTKVLMQEMEDELGKEDSLSFIEHKVKKGETIYAVSRKYNCKVNDIVKWNKKTKRYSQGIDWDGEKRTGSKKLWLYENEILRVMDLRYHIVQSGENLFRLAIKYKCTKEELKSWSSISNTNPDGIDWNAENRTGDKLDWIYVGDKLRILAK